MKRKNFLKCSCSIGLASCVGLGTVAGESLFAKVTEDEIIDKKNPLIPVDTRQVQNVLSHVENTMDENVKKSIFDKLGYEHTTDPGFIDWINGYKKDLKKFFDRINSDKDTYWEKIEYDPKISAIKITGKPVDRCACAYAQAENAPKSLCNYCCKSFEKHMFEMLLDKTVRVEVNKAFLLGGKRCSSTIYVSGTLQLNKI